jgi:Uma2 family endonuclease
MHYSYEEYLRTLEMSPLKLEYCDGEIYAMAGGTPEHATLAARMIRLVGTALLERCEVYASDLKIRVDATDLSTFPDATVLCGETRASPIDSNAVTNPTVIVEVTSASTEDYDRAEKLSHYKQIQSLHAALIVSHRRPQITVVERTDSDWTQREHRAGEHVVLRDPELRIAVDDVYRGVELRQSGSA